MKKKRLGYVRIIGGQWRGRKLPVPCIPQLRPTTNRIRETVFNWLTPYLFQSRCLDCFSGSGALGFESASRGSVHTTLLDINHHVIAQLKKNISLIGTNTVFALRTNALDWLTQKGTPYDIVFLDPPFSIEILNTIVQLLEYHNWLAQTAWIYIESPSKKPPPQHPPTWYPIREKTAGQITYRLYCRKISYK